MNVGIGRSEFFDRGAMVLSRVTLIQEPSRGVVLSDFWTEASEPTGFLCVILSEWPPSNRERFRAVRPAGLSDEPKAEAISDWLFTDEFFPAAKLFTGPPLVCD